MLTGARQVGKSTLGERMAARMRAQVVSLDDPATRSAAREDPSGFIDRLRLPAMIDEVQRAPELVYSIKQTVDRLRLGGERAAGSFLLTGSASTWDTLESPESLAGRIERVELWPFSQGELLGRRERFIDALFDGDPPSGESDLRLSRADVAKLVVRGGYPEAQARSEPRMQDWFSQYLALVLDRDIRDLANVRRPEDLLRLLRLCATRIGSPTNVDAMLRDLGIALSTGRRYFDLLGRVHLVREIPAWGVNLARAAVRSPKLVIVDSGLAAHLVECSAEKFVGGPDARPGPGHLFENFVTTELIKASAWSRADVKAFHWKDRSGREVDLLLERRDGTIVAIEHKLSGSVGNDDFRHLAYLRDQLGDRFVAGAIVYTGEATLPFGDRLWAAPVAALWS
jgi:uncharacterized protein